MVSPHTDERLAHYTEAYRKLYRCNPSELRLVDGDWVKVNGEQVSVAELDLLTQQIRREYEQIVDQRRQTVERLVGFLKQ
jgi:hypothetical protein